MTTSGPFFFFFFFYLTFIKQSTRWSTGQPPALFTVFCSSSAYSSAGKQVSTTPFPFYPSPFLIDTALFCFSAISSPSILQDISFFPSLTTIESEPFQSSLSTGHLLSSLLLFSIIKSEPFQSTLPQDISFFPSPSKVNHFNLTLPSLPTFQFSYQPLSIFSSKTCIPAFSATKLHTSFSFTSSDNFIAYLLLQITLLCICTPFLLLFSFHSSKFFHIIIHMHLFSVV